MMHNLPGLAPTWANPISIAPARSSGSNRPSVCCPWLRPTPRKLKRTAIMPEVARLFARATMRLSFISLLAGWGLQRMTMGACSAVAGVCTTPSRRKEGWPLLWNVIVRSTCAGGVMFSLSATFRIIPSILYYPRKSYASTSTSLNIFPVRFFVAKSYQKVLSLGESVTILTNLSNLCDKTLACEAKNVILKYDIVYSYYHEGVACVKWKR